jgi:hypothetical protein
LQSVPSICCAGLVDLRDAGVLQPAKHFHLELEAAQTVGRQRVGPDDLQGHAPSRPLLLGEVNHAHATSAEHAMDLIRANVVWQRFGRGRGAACVG